MLCGSNKAPTLKQPLSATNYPELIFSIKNSKLKFDSNEGVFKQISNDDPNYRKGGNEDNRLYEEEEILKKEICIKKDKLKYLKDKIIEIENKNEMMEKILSIDISEKNYITDLKNKLSKN